jgi:hypothetical protein
MVFNIFIISIISIVGCATVPKIRVWRPWTRVFSSTENIQPGARIAIRISGHTIPLMGNEDLLIDRISEKTKYLLERRGFIIDNALYEYRLVLMYETKREDKTMVSSSISSLSRAALTYYLLRGSRKSHSLGVSIAQDISALLISTYGYEKSVTNEESYCHTICVEIYNSSDDLIWKGESNWDSRNIDILSDMIPGLQLIFSDLPSNPSIIPEVPEVKPSHILNYYKLNVINSWFACPALPYRISFGQNVDLSTDTPPPNVSDPNAFAAFMDLIQTAEYALPTGGNVGDDPLRESLWKKVMLGHQYLLGPDKKPINILIKLHGAQDGYYVSKCWIASDKEFVNFQKELLNWKIALEEYYNLFRQ